MKKLNLFILFTLIISSLISCKKQNESISGSTNHAQLEKSQQIIRLIKDFDTKINRNFKTKETLSVDSLVWYTEALENYNNARPDLQYEHFELSKTTYTVLLDNGSLSIQDAAILYESMQTDLVNELSTLNPTEDRLKLTDIALDSIIDNTAYLSANRVFGLKISAIYDAFGEDDDWIWGTIEQTLYGDPPAGKCDGTMYGISDGSDELMRRLNNPKFVYDQQFFIVDIVTIEYINGNTWIDSNGNPLLFWINSTQPDYDWYYCLTNEDLTEQLTNAHTILYNYEGQGGVRPQGLDLSNVIIIDDFLGHLGISNLLHNYNATYGIRVLKPIED